MNAQQLFFALMGDEEIPAIFKSDHTPEWKGLKWFIKDLHYFEGVQQTYDYDTVKENIIEGYLAGEMVTMNIGGLTDKYFRDGNH